jgi:hypothetical protein
MTAGLRVGDCLSVAAVPPTDVALPTLDSAHPVDPAKHPADCPVRQP